MPRVSCSIRILALLLASAILASISACRFEGRHERRIAVISMTGGQLYWENFQRAIVPLAGSFGYSISFSAPQSAADYELQASMVADAVQQHVDGIIVAPSHQLVLASILKRAHQARIPVVVAASPIALSPDEYSAYIGLDNAEAGTIAAQRLIALMHGRGNVAVIGVSPTLKGSSEREKAFAAEIGAHSQIKIVSVKYGLSDWARSRQATLDALREHNLQGIFTSDEFATLGAISALANMPNRPKFVGVGQEPDTVNAVRSGEMDAIIVSNPRVLGTDCIRTLHAVFSHQPFQERQILPMKLLDKSTLDDPSIMATR